MIKQLDISELPNAVEVIRASFATVADELGLTEQNCPGFTAFSTTTERLRSQFDLGWRMYGFYNESRLAGYAAISKADNGAYEIHNLAVLPECRHKGYGKRLLDFCIGKVKEMGGIKIEIGIVEENTVLKNWYAANGFTHTGAKRFDFFPFTCGYMEYNI
ncbi:MAG: GNAT family N-acetyltransferase [Firmicutes bacterium]|nr:GNAT family N-acetyltransferase [Bacillota bacterium]